MYAAKTMDTSTGNDNLVSANIQEGDHIIEGDVMPAPHKGQHYAHSNIEGPSSIDIAHSPVQNYDHSISAHVDTSEREGSSNKVNTHGSVDKQSDDEALYIIFIL